MALSIDWAYPVGALAGIAGLLIGIVIVEEARRWRSLRYGPLGEPRARVSIAPPGFRAARLTVAQAEALGLPLQRVATPWSISGETVALLVHDRVPCQVCWHARAEHSADAEDDYMCLRRECACPGFDGFIDP